MPCYHPLPGWYARRRNAETGRRGVVFSLASADERRPIDVPCGRCLGCLQERSRQWAVRLMHENKLHEDSGFLTLTYDEEHVPRDGSLRPRDFTLFMKRLRKEFGEGIRYFQCGEYGERLERPHHHALLFGLRFPDLRPYKQGLSTSAVLDGLWGNGYCSVGEVTFESAQYVAGYVLKKVVGPSAESWYKGRLPEYVTMSRRPGIGRAFIEKYRGEVFKADSVIVNGRECKPPRYYDTVQEQLAPKSLARVKSRRRAEAEASPDNTGRRLYEREAVKMAQVVNLTSRRLEAYNGGRQDVLSA